MMHLRNFSPPAARKGVIEPGGNQNGVSGNPTVLNGRWAALGGTIDARTIPNLGQHQKWQRLFLPVATLIATIHPGVATGQTPSTTLLTIDLQNAVEYQQDISDPAKFATNSGITPSVQPKNFFVVTLIADVVAVNGQPAKGTYIGRTQVIAASPTPSAGGTIADVTRTALREHMFEILRSDGTSVGTIISLGFSGGPAPPGTGAPASEKGNWAIVGGTGAYMGARGQVSGLGGAGRSASMAEDPGMRRINGGTSFSFLAHVMPASEPRILNRGSGPVIVHSSDFSPVTAAKPAAAGEILALFAVGLGATTPDVDPSQLFVGSPLAEVNSPIGVTVNGKAATVLNAVGYRHSVFNGTFF